MQQSLQKLTTLLYYTCDNSVNTSLTLLQPFTALRSVLTCRNLSFVPQTICIDTAMATEVSSLNDRICQYSHYSGQLMRMTFYVAVVFSGIQSDKCLRPATTFIQTSKAAADSAWELILLFLLSYLIRGVHKFYCRRQVERWVKPSVLQQWGNKHVKCLWKQSAADESLIIPKNEKAKCGLTKILKYTLHLLRRWIFCVYWWCNMVL
jgi:hypothetical protein